MRSPRRRAGHFYVERRGEKLGEGKKHVGGRQVRETGVTTVHMASVPVSEEVQGLWAPT